MSLTHILILGLICAVVFGRDRIPKLGRGIGDGLKEFKKGVRGEGDIDVTDSVKTIKDEEER